MSRDIQITTLTNGIQVVSDSIPHVETITLGCWFNVGARDEESTLGGAAHFLEHMAFKGTKRRTARGLAEEVEAIGGFMNAYTGRERTAFHIRMLKGDMALGVDILADILQNPTFDHQEFERERGVILQEIGQSEDTPDDIIFDRFQAASYPDHAMGRPILGAAKRIKTYKPSDIAGFMFNHYACDNMVVAAAGNIKHDDFVKEVERQFQSLPLTSRQGEIVRLSPTYKPLEHREARPNEQVHLLLGFDALSYHDPDYIAMNLMGNLFGGGMSSRLFQRIREEMGLVYSIYSMEMPASDSGLFAIYAGTGKEEVSKLLPSLVEEIHKMKQGLQDAELQRAKAQMRSSLLMSRESTSSRAEQIAHHLQVYGRIIPDNEILEQIEAISKEDITRAAQRIFASPAAMANLGPIDFVPSLAEVQAQLA